MKVLAILIILSFSINNLSFSQEPYIKWWYDFNDPAYGSSAFDDIDGDTKPEIVFSCYRGDTCIHAINAEDGSLLWKVNTGGCNDVAPIIYDVDLDGTLEVVVPASCVSKTFCIEGPTGDIEWEVYGGNSDSPPTIGDIDNDEKPEILYGSLAGNVWCLNGEDGSTVWDHMVNPDLFIITEPILFDADNDNQLDFIVGTWSQYNVDKLFCYSADNHELNWESDQPSDQMYHGASFADIDSDGKIEIAIATFDGVLHVLNSEDGSLKWDFSFSDVKKQNFSSMEKVNYFCSPPTSIADLNNDGAYEIIFFDFDHLAAVDSSGEALWSFILPNESFSFRGAAISDINNDDTLDVIFGTNDGILYVLNGSNGEKLWDFNLKAHHGGSVFEIIHAPIISDFDDDGLIDIFICGGKSDYPYNINGYGRGYMMSAGSKGGPDWSMFRRDYVRSSCIHIKSSTSIEEKDIAIENINIFPNPTPNIFTIQSNNTEYVDILITDIAGKRILRKNKTKQPATIDLTNHQNGIYFIRIIVDDEIYSTKIIKK